MPQPALMTAIDEMAQSAVLDSGSRDPGLKSRPRKVILHNNLGQVVNLFTCSGQLSLSSPCVVDKLVPASAGGYKSYEHLWGKRVICGAARGTINIEYVSLTYKFSTI
jgi:hypothetical protein